MQRSSCRRAVEQTHLLSLSHLIKRRWKQTPETFQFDSLGSELHTLHFLLIVDIFSSVLLVRRTGWWGLQSQHDWTKVSPLSVCCRAGLHSRGSVCVGWMEVCVLWDMRGGVWGSEKAHVPSQKHWLSCGNWIVWRFETAILQQNLNKLNHNRIWKGNHCSIKTGHPASRFKKTHPSSSTGCKIYASVSNLIT